MKGGDRTRWSTTTTRAAADSTTPTRGSRRRSTPSGTRPRRTDQPRRLLLRPEGRHRRRTPRGHEDGAGVVGEGLHAGTSRSRSTSRRTSSSRPGTTGTANWKVDVTQTGFVARNAVVSGHDHGRRTRTSDGRHRRRPSPTRVVDCDGRRLRRPYGTTGLTVPANGSDRSAPTRPRATRPQGGTNDGDRHGDARRRRRLGLRDGGLHRSATRGRDQQDGQGRRRQEHLERHHGHHVVHRTTRVRLLEHGPDERRRTCWATTRRRRGRDGLRARHGLGDA